MEKVSGIELSLYCCFLWCKMGVCSKWYFCLFFKKKKKNVFHCVVVLTSELGEFSLRPNRWCCVNKRGMSGSGIDWTPERHVTNSVIEPCWSPGYGKQLQRCPCQRQKDVDNRPCFKKWQQNVEPGTWNKCLVGPTKHPGLWRVRLQHTLPIRNLSTLGY